MSSLEQRVQSTVASVAEALGVAAPALSFTDTPASKGIIDFSLRGRSTLYIPRPLIAALSERDGTLLVASCTYEALTYRAPSANGSILLTLMPIPLALALLASAGSSLGWLAILLLAMGTLLTFRQANRVHASTHQDRMRGQLEADRFSADFANDPEGIPRVVVALANLQNHGHVTRAQQARLLALGFNLTWSRNTGDTND